MSKTKGTKGASEAAAKVEGDQATENAWKTANEINELNGKPEGHVVTEEEDASRDADPVEEAPEQDSAGTSESEADPESEAAEPENEPEAEAAAESESPVEEAKADEVEIVVGRHYHLQKAGPVATIHIVGELAAKGEGTVHDLHKWYQGSPGPTESLDFAEYEVREISLAQCHDISRQG